MGKNKKEDFNKYICNFDKIFDLINNLSLKIDANQNLNTRKLNEIIDILQVNLDRIYKNIESHDTDLLSINKWIDDHKNFVKN